MNKRRIKVNIIGKIILILVLFISVFINIENVSAATKEAYLTTGQAFNNKLNKNVTGMLRKATLAEYNAATSTSLVSTDDSPYPVYVWSDGTDILYYTEAEKMYMNENSYRMFSDLKVTSIDLSDFDSSLVTNMNDLFERYKGTSIDVSNLNTSNVTTMYGVFWGAENLETIEGLENFDTRNVTSMSEMFYYCESLKTIEGLENFDTHNVTNMNRMFYSCTSLEEIDLSGFDTSASPSVHSMFEDAKSLRSVYVSNKWDNTKLGDSTNMFEHTQNLIGYYGFAFVQGGNSTYHDKTYARADTEDPNNRGFFTDVSHKGEMNTVTYPDGTVEVYPHNSKIDIPTNDGSKPNEKVAEITFKYHDDITADTTMDVEKVYYQNGWYVNNEHYWNGTRIVVGENLLLEYCFGENIARVETFPRPEREGYSFVGWWTDEYGGERIYTYAETEDITLHAHWSDPFAELDTGYNVNNKINGISHTDEYGDAKYFRKATEEEYNNLDKDTLDDYYNIISNEDSGELIYAWNAGESVLYYSKTDNILMNEDSSYMFSYSTFEEIDLSGLDPSNVTNMENMFQECYNLTNIVFGDNFDTSNVTNMHNMFTGCSALQSVDFSKLDTSNVTDMSYMFYNCDSLTTFNFDDLDTSSATDMSYMFAYDYALTTVDMSKANLSSLTNAGGMFYNCTSLSDFTFTRRLTSNITDITGMFEGCTSLEELSLVSLDTSNIQYISSMFYGMTNLRTIYVSDYWDTSNMEYSDYVFYDDENLIGEKGTTFDSDHIDAEYAIVDDAPDHPGYLTHADVYTVYYPDGSIELYRDGETLTLGVNNYTDSCSSVLHVWLDYNIGDGGDPAPTDVCVNSTGNGWKIDDVHYDDGDTLTVHNDIHVAYDTTESVYFPLPQNVEHEDWEFLGWYVGDTKWEKEYFDELADAMFVAHWNTGQVRLTVDDEVSIIPKGMGVIPEAKEKADDVIPITLVYQDNETPNGVVNMTYKHEFEGYKKQNYWRVYNPGEEYDYQEDTYFYSSYNDEWIYDELPYIDDDHFKGWWTEPEGGERVDELEYMRGYYEDYGYDTLYAHWGEPTVEICHGKGDCEEIVKGTAVVLERPEPTVITAHFTLDYNTEEPGYPAKEVTTTRTDTVEYFMINNERYDFGETYVFNENVDMYGVTTYTYTSDFEGYYNDNWDYGLNINGYELRGWCATTDGRYCRYYDEDEDIVQPDGLTLYASYWSSDGDTVQVTVDWDKKIYDWPKGESEVLPDEVYDTIDFDVPEDYYRDITFDLNDGTGNYETGRILVHPVFIGYRVGNDDSRRYQRHDLYTFYKDIHIQSQYEDEFRDIEFPNVDLEGFKGWYTAPEGGRKITNTEDFVKYVDLYNEFTLYAQYYDGLVQLTVDGKTTEVEPGYVYTVPNATPDPYAPVNNKIHIHLYYMDEEDTQKDVVISEGYSIGYQIINGDTYYPGDTYVVNDETEVVSIYDWNGQYAMDPYIKEPTRDGYIFMGWQLYNWEYDDVSDINVDIYNIEPYYTWFDGASFYAEWQEEPDPDEYAVVRYKDYIKKKDYKKIYPKGYVYTFGDLGEVNPFDVEIRNNVNDDTATVTYTTHITSDSYTVKIVGSDDESWRNSNNWYHPGDTYEINEDIEIEVLTSAYTDNSHYNGGCSGDTYLCELAYDTADNSRYNNYIFRGVYTEENGQGIKLNPHAIMNNNTYYGSHNGFNTLWVYLEEVDENSVVVTVDSEVFIMPKGEGTIPSPSITSETANYIITYKFNNGDPDVLGIDTVRYYMGSLNYNGDEYQPGDTFDFEEDTTFWSNWELEPIGDDLLEVNDEHFLGWFDENDNQVTSLDDIDDNITLYAHWDYPDVNVTLEGQTDTVPYGFTYDLAGFKNFQRTVDAGTITFHDESGNYEGEVWTTSAQRTPSKAYINDVEYELDGEYTFIEDTVIEFEYEFEFTDEELPRDKSIMGREHYTFGGWYDNPDYEGDPITKYSGMNNIDVYAKWIGEEVIVILNEDEGNPLIYHYGDTYTFGDLPESFVWDMGNEIFDFNDGVTPNSTQHLIMTIYPDTWFYYGYDENGDHVDNTYNAGDTVTLYGETWIGVGSEDDNNYVYSGVTIPDDPEREHYTFDGWYNEWDYKVTNINELNGFDQVITAKWIGEDVTVHLPDEDITVEYGREYPTYENNYPKANTKEAAVTFKYHDGETDDYVSYVEKSYTPNGWLINDTHYGEDTIVFTEETTLVPDYAETVIPVEFPSAPTWFRHDFDGWFTEETGGEQVTSYSDLVDTELHAHWHDHMAIITTPDGDVQVDENKQFTFPTNNIPKNNTNVGTIKFDPQNGQPIISKTAVKSYTPNGWLLDGVHYDDGETITVLDDSTITPDYTETISVELPENPIKPNYTFKGWYSAMNGGDKVEVSDMKSAMTVYAHYYETNTEGEEYKLPSNQPVKPTEILATVTFDPHNGDPVTTSTVTKKWMAKGWLVDGVQYYNGDVIYRTPDTVIEPNYTYVIVSAQFPVAPTRGNERYTGWYTQETGGEQVKNYEGTEDITLHAHYTDNYAVLIDGETINGSICLMYNSNWSCSSGLVRKFEEGTYEQYQAKADSARLISTDDSPYPVYLWMQYPNWYYYTEADTIYFNENSNHFFAKYFQSVETINIDKFNSSYVTDFGYFFWNTGRNKRLDVLPIDKLDTSNAISMNYMLSGISNTSVDFSNFNTARVENFSDFLSGASVTSLDVSHLNTSSAKNMYGMFSNLKITSIDVSNFDTSNATDIGGMFKYTDLVSLDLSNFDTSNVTYMGGLISGTSKLESVNLSSFNTSNVTSFNQFMLGSGLREIDLSSFDTSNTKDFYEMFAECPNLEKIWVSDKWDSSSLTSGTRTFYESPKLIGQRGSTYTGSNAYHAYANTNGQYAYNRIDMAPEKPGYFWDKYANKYTITLPDGIEEVYEGAPFVVPTNTYPKNLEIEYTITFDPMNGEEVITSNKMKTYEPAGFTDGENVYESGSTIYVTGDMTLTPYYNEVVVEPDFPEDPIKTGNKFEGWYTEGGDKVETLENIDDDIILYAHWSESLPTDFDVDSENITMVVGETHQIEVTVTPDGTEDTVTYTGYDGEKISITDGLVTALAKGDTTITVGLEHVPDKTKEITVTVLSDRLESEVYDVREEDIDAGKDRIIIGAEPNTTIGEFKDNLLNPNEYVKIYDIEGNELDDDVIVMTGQVIKLEYNGIVVDEAILVLRGDVNGDGIINVSDYLKVLNHSSEKEELQTYIEFAAADVAEDEILNVSDYLKIKNYAAEKLDTLND